MTTRLKISEQIQLAYARYLDKNNFLTLIDKREIDLLLEQVINKYFRLTIQQNLVVGTTEIPKVAMLNYTIAASGNAITLPVIPMALPNDMGVYSVASAAAPLVFFIPIPNQFLQVYGSSRSELTEGQTGYYRIGNTVTFVGTVTGNVNVTVIASDFSLFATSDMLPILPEMEADIIKEVLSVLVDTRAAQQELNSRNIDGRDNA
jgi:hypothetical protein